MDLTTVKTVAVFIVIIGCFTALYPKIFHPLLFGGSTPKREPHEEIINNLPPHMREKRPGDGAGAGVQSKEAMNMARQMHRPGPHPGMRAAAEMRKAQAGGGGGRGMMGIILPVYAVGIVMYLVYTLAKIFSKKQDTTEYDDNMREHYRELKFDPNSKRFTYDGMDQPQSGEEKTGFEFFADKRNQDNLEDLLLKADEKNISNNEMQQLRMKLEETEAQMARILGAMQVVQNQSSDLARAAGESVDSSPDLDSYEVVNGGDRRTRPEQDSENFGDCEDFYEESDESEAHIEDIGPIDDEEMDARYSRSTENYTQEKEPEEQQAGREAQDTDSKISEPVSSSGDTKDQVTEQTECGNNDPCDVAGEETLLTDNTADDGEANPNLRHRVVTEPTSHDQE